MRYTRHTGKALMEMKVVLTFACMNLDKLAKMKKRKGLPNPYDRDFLSYFYKFVIQIFQKKRPSDALEI